MPEFSTILQDPAFRQIVQENALTRAFYDGLFPNLLFRSEAVDEMWPDHSGDNQLFTGRGLLPLSMKPLAPMTDPTPARNTWEQWEAVKQIYGNTVDVAMNTSTSAIVDLFLAAAHDVGLQGARTVNRLARNRMYNAAESGWTVADGSVAQSGTTLRVKRLNGFTRARRPDLTTGSPVRYAPVSTSNPLVIRVFDNGSEVTRNVTGFTPDTTGDEIGPGTITVSVAFTSVADRAYVIASDATTMVRVGGGNSTDAIGNTDLIKLANIRQAIANFWQNNVPEHADRRFHCHLDPTSIAQLFGDDEFQRLNTSLPDYVMYREFALGELLNVIFFRNTEAPIPQTVIGGDTAVYSQDEGFAPELWSNGNTSTGNLVHRPLLTGQGGIIEYWQDLMGLVTEAGLTAKLATPQITNNGIQVMAERIQLILRSPQNRLQDVVAVSWKIIADWVVRTDGATGGPSRYKRFEVVQHGTAP